MYRPRNVLLAAFIAVALGGCGGDDVSPTDADRALRRQATESTEAPTTTVPVDPFAIPETIDAAYVERVANELYRVIGEAGRIAQKERAVPPEVTDRLTAAYDQEVVEGFIRLQVEDVAAGFPGVREEPGDTVIRVAKLTHAERSCIIADATLDPSPVLTAPQDPVTVVLALSPRTDSQDAKGYNETPWVIRETTVPSEFQLERDGCV